MIYGVLCVGTKELTMTSNDKRIAEYREQLESLKCEWINTPPSDKIGRRRLKRSFGIVYRGLEDCGVGGDIPLQNTPPEYRDLFSIWHIRNQRVEIPPTLDRRQAVECLTNGSCGD